MNTAGGARPNPRISHDHLNTYTGPRADWEFVSVLPAR